MGRCPCCVLSSDITFSTSFLSVVLLKDLVLLEWAHSCFRFVHLHGREEGAAILARRALATEEIFD